MSGLGKAGSPPGSPTHKRGNSSSDGNKFFSIPVERKVEDERETYIKEMAEKMIKDLLKIDPSTAPGKNNFLAKVDEYEELIFSKYRVSNPETESIKKQVEKLKEQYEQELAADKYMSINDEQNYLNDFLDFDRPPIVPEEVAQTEYYRPNPAAFQRRLNDNPYAVDVGFASLEAPIYSKLEDFPARMNTRANSQAYDPRESMNRRSEHVAPKKPFVQQLNTAVYEKAQMHGISGGLDEVYLRSLASGGFGGVTPLQHAQQSAQSMAPRDREFKMFDLLRDPEAVILSDKGV